AHHLTPEIRLDAQPYRAVREGRPIKPHINTIHLMLRILRAKVVGWQRTRSKSRKTVSDGGPLRRRPVRRSNGLSLPQSQHVPTCSSLRLAYGSEPRCLPNMITCLFMPSPSSRKNSIDRIFNIWRSVH